MASAALKKSWAAQVEALREIDAKVPEKLQSLAVLDALGDRLTAEPLRKIDDGLDNMLIRRTCDEIADELDIDLQVSDGQPLHMGERAEAGTEIIQGETQPRATTPRANASPLSISRMRAVSVISKTRLEGSAPASIDLVLNQRQQIDGDHRLGGQVRRDMAPFGREADGLFHDPLIDLRDEAVFLRHTQEGARGDDLTVPADHTKEKLLAG